MKVFGREPVVVVETAVALFLAITLFFNFNPDVQGLVNAALATLGGFVAAWFVSAERALPMLAGVAKAIIALIIGLGVDVPAPTQAGIMAVIAVLTAFFLRDRVVAPVPMQTAAHEEVPPVRRATGGHI